MKTVCTTICAISLATGLATSTNAATIVVTGGSGADLVNALTTANPGDIVEIRDSLTYDLSAYATSPTGVIVNQITLRSGGGAQPTIFAEPSTSNNGVFTLRGNATNPGTIEGLRFEAGALGRIFRYINGDTQHITIRNNEFTLQNLDRNFNSGRAISLQNANTPSVVVERNLFHTTQTGTTFHATVGLEYVNSAGSILRNNVFDLTGMTSTSSSKPSRGIWVNNENGPGGTFTDTMILNNTFLFRTEALAYGIWRDNDAGNPFKNWYVQNNIFIDADYALFDALDNGSTSVVTLSYNLFDNLTGAYSAQAEDNITTNNNISGVGIALLNGEYRPQTGTLALNTGLNGLSYGAIDFYGDQRVRGAAIDIGAVEIPEPTSAVLLAGVASLVVLRRRTRRNGQW